MGKGTIVGHLGEAEYTVTMAYKSVRIERDIERLTNKAALLAGMIAEETDPVRKQLLQANLINTQQRLRYLEAQTTTEADAIWCADYTLDVSGDVGLAEIPGENISRNILPAFSGNTFSQGTHGIIEYPIENTPAGAAFNYAVRAWWQKFKPTFRYGTITAIDYDTHICSVDLESALSSSQQININQAESLSDILISYMDCDSAAFVIGDDVLVKFNGQDWTDPTVIGFKDHPVDCCSGMILFSGDGDYFESEKVKAAFEISRTNCESVFPEMGNIVQVWSKTIDNFTVFAALKNYYILEMNESLYIWELYATIDGVEINVVNPSRITYSSTTYDGYFRYLYSQFETWEYATCFDIKKDNDTYYIVAGARDYADIFSYQENVTTEFTITKTVEVPQYLQGVYFDDFNNAYAVCCKPLKQMLPGADLDYDDPDWETTTTSVYSIELLSDVTDEDIFPKTQILSCLWNHITEELLVASREYTSKLEPTYDGTASASSAIESMKYQTGSAPPDCAYLACYYSGLSTLVSCSRPANCGTCCSVSSMNVDITYIFTYPSESLSVEKTINVPVITGDLNIYTFYYTWYEFYFQANDTEKHYNFSFDSPLASSSEYQQIYLSFGLITASVKLEGNIVRESTEATTAIPDSSASIFYDIEKWIMAPDGSAGQVKKYEEIWDGVSQTFTKQETTYTDYGDADLLAIASSDFPYDTTWRAIIKSGNDSSGNPITPNVCVYEGMLISNGVESSLTDNTAVFFQKI